MVVRILGVDPGNGGALVTLEEGLPVEWIRMPTFAVGKNTRVNCAALARWIHEQEIVEAFVENVGAMPGQGVTSMFTFGHAAGSVLGVLGAFQIPVTMVTPVTWKKRAALTGTDKDSARSLAIQIWPKWDALDKKIEGQALADAALIAKFGSE
jgi:crossover junction endodeoxyribonuclease RuvC